MVFFHQWQKCSVVLKNVKSSLPNPYLLELCTKCPNKCWFFLLVFALFCFYFSRSTFWNSDDSFHGNSAVIPVSMQYSKPRRKVSSFFDRNIGVKLLVGHAWYTANSFEIFISIISHVLYLLRGKQLNFNFCHVCSQSNRYIYRTMTEYLKTWPFFERFCTLWLQLL